MFLLLRLLLLFICLFLKFAFLRRWIYVFVRWFRTVGKRNKLNTKTEINKTNKKIRNAAHLNTIQCEAKTSELISISEVNWGILGVMIMIRPGVAVFIGSMRAHMHLGVAKRFTSACNTWIVSKIYVQRSAAAAAAVWFFCCRYCCSASCFAPYRNCIYTKEKCFRQLMVCSVCFSVFSLRFFAWNMQQVR